MIEVESLSSPLSRKSTRAYMTPEIRACALSAKMELAPSEAGMRETRSCVRASAEPGTSSACFITFDRVRDKEALDNRALAMWERRFVAGTASVFTALGFLSFYSIYVVNDPFAELVSLSLVFALFATVVGRNYSSRPAVVLASLGALLPPMVAFALEGAMFHVVFALLFIAYFLTNIQMTKGLRDTLFDATMGKHSLALVAKRFDCALNNMPQGLLMFDADQRIAVSNNKARTIFRLPDNVRLHGRSVDVLLRYSVRHKVFSADELGDINKRFFNLLAGRQAVDVFRLADGRHVECIGNPVAKSGAVLIIEDVTQRLQVEARIHHMARYDALTELPNRNHFATLVHAHLYRHDPDHYAALIVIDIDHFKHINDMLGHQMGDIALRQIADRLNALDPKRYIASRFGSDEFVVFVSSLTEEQHVSTVTQELIGYLCGEYDLDGNKVPIQVTAGVVTEKACKFDVANMHIKADLALYEARRGEKQRWAVFAETMDIKYRNRQQLKADLRQAIVDRNIHVVYQPIIDLHSLRIVSCEALARWNHPTLGPVPPTEFIPLAEEMGMISEITRLVLHQACKDCHSWGDRICVSVNLSAIDLRNNQIMQDIAAALDSVGLPPRCLEVEVTETAIIADRDKASALLARLKNSGITVSLDDVGCGYSSFSYLNTLPLNKVKIDRTFVRDVMTDKRSLMLLRGITQLSHDLGLAVTVEGVETEEQLALIRVAAGADLVQGFLLGKPTSSDEIRRMIAQKSTGRASVQPVLA